MSPWILVHAAATWAMVGFIWTIQLVQYPLMAEVGPENFAAYVEGHQRRVVVVLGVFAVVEAVSAAVVGWASDAVPTWLWLGAGTLLAAIWIATGAFFAPLHGRLAADGFDADRVRLLVATNWFRTLAWTIRGVAAGAMVVLAAR
ncbi:MAG: hypothetical protein ABIO83_10950 [Ilumatobacteraceae bacterium]